MNSPRQNQILTENHCVEFFLEPSECLALMDAVIFAARHQLAGSVDDCSSQLYDIYDDLSLALNQTLTGQFDQFHNKEN